MILNQPNFIMNSKAYEAPVCTAMDLNCEGSFCLAASQGEFGNVNHNGFVGSDDYDGDWGIINI